MPSKPANEDWKMESGAHGVPPSTIYSQPWWQGVGSGAMASSLEHINGSVTTGAIPLQANGDGINKEGHNTAATQSGLNGNDGQGQQQMELVGHSIVLTSYPYPDPHYGGMMTYGAQVHPHLLGLCQTRMPLPLEMEEEPVYVNAKQYHGILRRRQSRAKAELEKKVIKARKPYLHESRHQHAMRRARGCGGRFLNTKTSNDITNPTSENEPKYSETVSNGNSNGHGFLGMYYSQSADSEKEGNRFTREMGSDLLNLSHHGTAPVK